MALRVIALEGKTELQGRLRALGDQAPLAVSRALTRAVESRRTSVIRELVAASGVRYTDVARRTKVDPASPTFLQAVLRVRSRHRPLIDFMRGVKPGQAVNLPTLPITPSFSTPPFAQIMPRSGHLGIFKRGGATRLPIHQLYGPSLQYIAASRGIMDNQTAPARDVLEKRLEHEINFLLSKRGG